MNHDSRDAHLMSGAYVLHALDPDERAEVEAAMRDSEELRGEIAELSDTAVVLGLAVRAEQPPAALRARVLALADSPQLAPLPEQADLVPSVPAARHVAGSAERRARARWYRRPVVLVAAAAAAAVLFAGGLGVDRLVNPPSQSTAFSALLVKPDVQKAQVAVAGGGTATAYWSAKENESAIVLTGVDTPSGHVLQLWRLRDGSVQSVGFYTPTSGSNFEMISGSLPAGSRYAVSVEPAGGSKQPTTKPIAALPSV